MKIIYVNPGESVEIRIIEDPDLPKNAKEFKYQTNPNKIFIKIIGNNHIQVCQAGLTISQAGLFTGKIKAFR